MRANTEQTSLLEARLRHDAPPLRAADSARVARACARLSTAAPAASPLRDSRTFTRPLLRLAACAALLLAVAVLLRPAHRATPPPAPSLPAVTTFGDLADLMRNQEVASALASEADRLTTDLSALSAVLNESTFAILF